MKYDYEVLTDEDLHRDGVAALKPYAVVINATHCEYYSERMLDATEDYLAEGGRLLYLSGNGYYWTVGFRDDEPWVMEVRKLEAGSRAWQARAGEHYLATTGERSGLWRHRNRAPQKLVGVGFTSEGHGRVGRPTAGCRTAITAPCPGSSRASKARCSAISAWRRRRRRARG